LRTAIREAAAGDERPGRVGTVDFEAVGARYARSEADVVEYRANRDDLAVVVDSLGAANHFGEEPRTHGVIEEIRL
jgi:hypothetical protein